MREIFFKAKRKENGEWVEGLLTKMWGQYHIINPEDENTAYLIDEETICQYTGMTDKNGKKIWENDIVKKVDGNPLGWHRERICKVSWDELGYWLIMTTLGDGYWLGEFDIEQLQVVGNIFDHAELLEK